MTTCSAFVPKSARAARRRPAHGRLSGAVAARRRWRRRRRRLSRSAGAEAGDRSAQSAALPEIRPARARATGAARDFRAAGVRRRRHRLRFHQQPQEGRRPSRSRRPNQMPRQRDAERRIAGDAQAIAPGLPRRSPYRPTRSRPPTTARAYAQAPGTPPVELGPIRKPPKKRKAHSEPDDPYAPLGVRVGAFTLFPAIELIGGYDTNPARKRRRQRRLALHRRAGTAGAVELVAARTQGRPARQLYRLQPRRDADAEPAQFQRQGRRPHRRHARHAHRSRQPRAGLDRQSRQPEPAGRSRQAADLHHLRRQRRPRPALQSLRPVDQRRRRAHRLSELEADRRHRPPATRTATTINSAARCAAATRLTPGVKPFVEVGADTRVHDLHTDISGYQRNSKGITGKVGSTFELSHLLTGEIAHRLYRAQLRRPTAGKPHRPDRRRLADLDRQRAHHRQAHRQILGRRIDHRRRFRRALSRRRLAGRPCLPPLADRQREARLRRRRLCRLRRARTNAIRRASG